MFTNEERKAFMQHFWSKFDEYGDTVPDIAWRKKKWICMIQESVTLT